MSNFFTLEQAQAVLTGAYNAVLKTQKAKEYQHEGVNIATIIKRQSLPDLQESIDYWSNICEEIEAGSSGPVLSQMVIDHEST